MAADELITPRTKGLLVIADEMLRDQGRSDVEDDDLNHWLLFDDYPRITHNRDAAWRRRALQSYDHLLAAMNSGRDPHPQCTAEEMALWFMIELAEAFEQDREAWPTVWEAIEELAASRDDFKWDDLREDLFQDHDFLMLYSPELDGIEDPASGFNAFMRIGPYLRPQDWFTPFGRIGELTGGQLDRAVNEDLISSAMGGDPLESVDQGHNRLSLGPQVFDQQTPSTSSPSIAPPHRHLATGPGWAGTSALGRHSAFSCLARVLCTNRFHGHSVRLSSCTSQQIEHVVVVGRRRRGYFTPSGRRIGAAS